MNTENILRTIQTHISLTPEEQDYFSASIVGQTIKHGEVIAKPNEITRYFIYVNTGCLMTYYTDTDGADHVMQFAMTGWWTGDLHSFFKQVPSIYTTRAIIDTEVFLITKNSLDSLLDKYPKFERYFRILFQNSLVAHQHRLRETVGNTAEERYQNFREKFPVLEQIVPLKYIASYLGFTPEFLSKIRRKQLEKKISAN